MVWIFFNRFIFPAGAIKKFNECFTKIDSLFILFFHFGAYPEPAGECPDSVVPCHKILKQIASVDKQLEKYMKKYWDLTADIVVVKDQMIKEVRSKKKLQKKYLKLVEKRKKVNGQIELLCNKNVALKSRLHSVKVSLSQ